MKIVWLALVVLLLSVDVAVAEDLVVLLSFAQKNNKRLGQMKSIAKQKIVSGILRLDVYPYPNKVEKDKYIVKYYFDKEMVYKTDGWDNDNQGILSFSYSLDTTKYQNGEYRLYVNYFDDEGNEAIGSRRILIINKE